MRFFIIQLLVFSLLYLFGFFPFAYFRHDDWMNIDAGVRAANDLKFLFSPTIFYGNEEAEWFFRPLFKLANLVFYKFFGLNHYFWLLAQFIILLGSLYLAYLVLIKIKNKSSAVLFVSLFIGSIHLQIGSLLWVGEGLMNSPLILLLMGNLFFLVEKKIKYSKTLAIFCYITALGFKEATVFHLLFLIPFVFTNNYFNEMGHKKKIRLLIPYIIVTLIFVLIRLLVMPYNKGYTPTFSLESFGILFGALLVPLFIFSLIQYKKFGLEFTLVYYLPFIFVSIIMFVGLPFFSPGWLILPGFFYLFIFSMLVKSDYTNKITIIGLTNFIFSLVLCFSLLFTNNWYKWRFSEKALVDIFKKSNPQTEKVVILDCYEKENGYYVRVIGGTYMIENAWHLIHGTKIKAYSFRACSWHKENESTIVLLWDFPNLKKLF